MALAADHLDFDIDGAVLHDGAALSLIGQLERALADLPPDRAGIRLYDRLALHALLSPNGPIGTLARARLGTAAKAVRAILFNKTEATNWALGWHQDRTIAVEQRRDIPGYGPWSMKAGIHHVEPPFDIIEAMITLRIHLDPVPADNAPLLIAPASQRLGRILEREVDHIVGHLGSLACLADRGDVWAYATPILHASSAAKVPGHRCVLQVDYAAADLPGGLAWAGI
ncbi:MAG: phytanoyl-CoA dioxygenase [Sphingomonas sp. 28-66-16]|nr:MAG: phytanoyl-CoA dioxygenase [Sphingomonas sp. 28-66-16]